MIGFFFLNSLRMSRGLFRWLTRFLFPELIRVTRVIIRSSEIPSSSLKVRLKRCHKVTLLKCLWPRAWKIFIGKFLFKTFISNFFKIVRDQSTGFKRLGSMIWSHGDVSLDCSVTKWLIRSSSEDVRTPNCGTDLLLEQALSREVNRQQKMKKSSSWVRIGLRTNRRLTNRLKNDHADSEAKGERQEKDQREP